MSAIYGVGWLIYSHISTLARHLGHHSWQPLATLLPSVPQNPEWTEQSPPNRCCWFRFKRAGGCGLLRGQCQPAPPQQGTASLQLSTGPSSWQQNSDYGAPWTGKVMPVSEKNSMLFQHSSAGACWAHWGTELELLDTLVGLEASGKADQAC